MIFWQEATIFSDVLAGDNTLDVSTFAFAAFPAPWVLQRTLLWWEYRVWNIGGPGFNSQQAPALNLTLDAVENDTAEPPPPGPPDPFLRTLVTAPHDAHASIPSPGSDSLFQSWIGNSGAEPLQSRSKRAAVNYSGGMLVRFHLRAEMGMFQANRLWWADQWAVYARIAVLIDDHS